MKYYVQWKLPSGVIRKTGPMLKEDADLVEYLILSMYNFDGIEVKEFTS